LLASAGLITPEFQLTSDTNVIRSSNFLRDGIFNPSRSGGGLITLISSFSGGNGDIALDFNKWLGNRPGTATPWTNNENVAALVDALNDLLLAGQLPSAGTNNYGTPRTIVNAKDAILNYVTNTANIAYNNTTPTDTNKRDRLRAIVHLIVTSPDFTIQK
jgi:hypothetical protein